MDKAGFKYVFDTYFDDIRSYVYYRYSEDETASDIAQDVFMRIWEKREQLDVENIRPLLYKMARDMSADYYRRQQVRLDFAKDMVPIPDTLTPQEQMQFEELKTNYSDALSRLSDDQRETFLMSRNDGLKYAEIAERLEISVKAVEKRMTTVLRFLHKWLYQNSIQ